MLKAVLQIVVSSAFPHSCQTGLIPSRRTWWRRGIQYWAEHCFLTQWVVCRNWKLNLL